MIPKCWKTTPANGFRRPSWLGLSLMFALTFALSAHARVSPVGPAAPGDPAKPGGTPAPSVTFGIGASDSVFAGGGRYRVVYDRRGDHGFRLISVRPALWASSIGAPLASPPTACGGSLIVNSASSPFNPVAEYSASCTIMPSATIFDISGKVGMGTDAPTVQLEVSGSASTSGSNIQGRVTNSNTTLSTPSVAYLSTAGGGDSGIVAFLESNAQFDSMDHISGKALVGTFTNFPLAFITDSTTNPTPSMWITSTGGATAGNVGIGTTSPSDPLEVNGTAAFDTNVGIGTTSPSANLEVNGTVKFDISTTNTINGAVSNPSGTPGVGTNVGMVFHMDGVKYTSLDSLITAQANGSYFTIYDDCPSGSETLSNDPFHPSNGLTYHVHLLYAPCAVSLKVPMHLKTGDTLTGAGPGYYQADTATPTSAGTIIKMDPGFPAAVTTLPAVPAATWTGSGGYMTNECYWVGITAVTLAGETPLVNGTYNSSSWMAMNSPPSGIQTLHVPIPTPAGLTQSYNVYVVQAPQAMGSCPSFVTTTAPVYQGNFTSSANLGTYQTSGNPPPNDNTTQALITLGPASNAAGNIQTNLAVSNLTVDCNGGQSSVAFANNSAQDPPSGFYNTQQINCNGFAGVVEEGYDGHVGANGSQIYNHFLVPSNCEAITNNCNGAGGTVTAAAFPIYAIDDDAVPQFKTITDVDVGADNCGDTADGGVCPMSNGGGIRLNAAVNGNSPTKANVTAIHCEGLAGAPLIGACVDDYGIPATIDGVHTSNQISYSVHLRSGTTATVVRNVIPGPARNAVYDESNTPAYQSIAGNAAGEYDIEQVGNFLNAAGNSNLAGGLTLGGPLATTDCVSSSGACGGASAGSVTISAGSSSVTVSTSAVTAKSQIIVTFDSSLGGAFGGSITCNTNPQAPYVNARTAGTSFTIKVASNFSTNPGCFSYFLVN